MSRSRSSVLIGILLTLFSGGIFLYAATTDTIRLTGIFWNPQSTGSFDPRWNAGLVDFTHEPTIIPPEWFSWVQLVHYPGNGTGLALTGTFWMENVGWTTFADVGAGPVMVIPPLDGQNIRTPNWYLSGYAWSQNAGWIALNHGDPTASGVIYLPDTSSFSGFAWSNTLGWISFWSGSFSNIARGFIGQVKVIGNIGGSKVFDVLSTLPWVSFNNTVLNNAINTIQKNVTLLLRNATNINFLVDINTSTPKSIKNSNGSFVVYSFSDNSWALYIDYNNISISYQNDKDRSLISIGWDIYINKDFNCPTNTPCSIIALKNTRTRGDGTIGDGGNIWISGNVKTIKATLVAEWSIQSGENFTPWQITPYYQKKASIFLDLPKTQLYINGSVLSHNTIWWWSKDGGAVCPYAAMESTCTYDNAIRYDWNYFRAYTGSNAWLAYKDHSLDAYSTIIEYDPHILSDPPPGLTDLR